MPKTRRIVSVFAMLVAAWTSSGSGYAQVATSLVGNMQVAPLGLETMWSAMVRVDPARGRVESLQVESGLLLAQTTVGTLQAIDAETGRTWWTADIGKSSYPTLPPSGNAKYVGITNGSTLYLLERSTGAAVWQQKLGGSPCAGTAMSDERIYVPLDSGLIEAYLLDRRTGTGGLFDSIPKRYSGAGGAVTAPIVVGKRVSWSVERGYVYSSEEGSQLTQFRFRTDDDVSASPVYMPPYLFAASRRGTVYGLEGVAGVEIWRLAAGSSVSHPPVAIEGALYIITETGDMLRLNPRTGAQVWYGRGVGRFVSAGNGKIYVVDPYGRLTARDAAGGAILGAAATYGFDLPCINTESDRIYLASSTGLIQALRESRQAKPLAFTAGYAIPPPPKEGEAPAADAATTGETPAAPAAPNPFGTP